MATSNFRLELVWPSANTFTFANAKLARDAVLRPLPGILAVWVFRQIAILAFVSYHLYLHSPTRPFGSVCGGVWRHVASPAHFLTDLRHPVLAMDSATLWNT